MCVYYYYFVVCRRHEEVRVQGKAVARAVLLLQGLSAADRQQEFHPSRPGDRVCAVLRGSVRTEVCQVQRGRSSTYNRFIWHITLTVYCRSSYDHSGFAQA